MISEQMQRLINYLIQVEMVSANLYLAMANYFNRINLTGIGTWLRLQHEEELTHARQLMDYLVDRGGTVQIPQTPAMPVQFGSPLQAFMQVLNHERSVTQAYRQAWAMASQAGDYQTAVVLQGFLQEQIDEEAQAEVITGRFQLAGENTAAILVLDQELGRRGAAPAAPAAPPGAGPAPAAG